jgi:hypothetical protein
MKRSIRAFAAAAVLLHAGASNAQRPPFVLPFPVVPVAPVLTTPAPIAPPPLSVLPLQPALPAERPSYGHAAPTRANSAQNKGEGS